MMMAAVYIDGNDCIDCVAGCVNGYGGGRRRYMVVYLMMKGQKTLWN